MGKTATFTLVLIAGLAGCTVGDDGSDDSLTLEGRGGSATLAVGPEAIWAGSSFYVSGCGYAYNKQNPATITLNVSGPQQATLTATVTSAGCLAGTSSNLPAGPSGTVAVAGDYTITATTASNTGRISVLATAKFTVITAPQSSCHMQFTARASLPTATTYPATTALDGHVYIFGGGVNNTLTTQALSYDASADTWSAIAPLPAALELPGATTDGKYLYIVGPKSRWVGTTVYRYDPSANSYTELATSIPLDGWAAQAGATVIYLNGKIYYFGGAPAEWYCTGYENNAVYDIASNTWTTAAQFPNDFTCGISAVAYSGSIYAAGGIGLFGGTRSAMTYRFDPAANAWSDSAVADLPMPRGGAATGVIGNLWFLAGADANNSVIAMDPSANRWSVSGSAQAGWGSGSTVLGSSLYIVGGGSDGKSVQQGSCN